MLDLSRIILLPKERIRASWVAMSMVDRWWSCNCRNTILIILALSSSRCEVGSSARINAGRFTTARAIAVRWHSPPLTLRDEGSCALPDW